MKLTIKMDFALISTAFNDIMYLTRSKFPVPHAKCKIVLLKNKLFDIPS